MEPHSLKGSFRGLPTGASSLLIIVITTALLFASSGRAANNSIFPVTQEQAVIGTTTGISGAQVADGNSETLGEVDSAVDPVTHPTAQTLVTGTVVSGSFPTSVQASDGNYMRYREATTSSNTVVQNPPSGMGAPCSWTNCDNGRLSDNLYATSNTDLQEATYNTFGLSVPAGATIVRVEVGMEAFLPVGNDRISITMSWDGGTTFCSNPQSMGVLPTADPNTYTYLDFTAACTGHAAWSQLDFTGNKIATKVIYNQVGPTPDTIDVDANVVRVTYNQPAYQLEVRYAFSGVPSGQLYTLAVKGAINTENVTVQMLNPPSTWVTRATFTSTLDQVITYNLTAAEFNAGNPVVRFTDADGPDAIASDLWIDEAKITTVRVAFSLDIRQNVTGITGVNPIVTIKGNISTGGENFDVQVWNSSASSWSTRLISPFSSSNDYHNFTLLSAEVSAGTVQVRFIDVNPASITPANLSLDFVGVSTTQLLPDLSVSASGISLSKATPNKGETITIDVVVSNLGGGDANNVMVQFKVGGFVVSSTSAGTIPAGGMATVRFTWVVGDSRDLTFTVDPQGNITESNRSNNEVTIQVGQPTSGVDSLVWVGVGGGIAAAALFIFFFLFWRKRPTGEGAPIKGRPSKFVGRGRVRARPIAVAKSASVDLQPGHAYLVEEEKPAQSLKILGDQTRTGRSGLLITRKNPKNLSQDFHIENTKSFWLADSKASGATQVLTSSLETILFTIDEFVKANTVGVILIDGVEFLVDNNNFNAVLRFLRRIVDLVSQGEQILLVSVSPGTLEERQLKALEREMDILRLT